MGWNCNACGHLLKPEKTMTYIAKFFWSFVLESERAPERLPFFPEGEPRVCSCPNCKSVYIVYIVMQAKQPRIYLGSVMICINDGESERYGETETKEDEKPL